MPIAQPVKFAVQVGGDTWSTHAADGESRARDEAARFAIGWPDKRIDVWTHRDDGSAYISLTIYPQDQAGKWRTEEAA